MGWDRARGAPKWVSASDSGGVPEYPHQVYIEEALIMVKTLNKQVMRGHGEAIGRLN